jgi:hypothetical protein
MRMSDQAGPPRSPWYAVLRPAMRRLPGMLGVWAMIGVAVGILTTPGPNPVGVVAGIIAGLIVMTPLAVVLTFIGGRGRDSLLGGLMGLALVPALVRFGDLPITQVPPVPFGIVLGALIGTTVVTAFYRFPRLVLAAGDWGRPAGLKRP